MVNLELVFFGVNSVIFLKWLNIKTLLLVAIFSVYSNTVLSVESKAQIGYKVGQIAPEFKLKSLDGKTHTLASLRKKGHVMLIFWAVECVYCYAEIPDLNAMHAKYANKGLTIAAINIGAEYNDDVAEYVKDNNIKYLILSNRLDNLDAAEAYHSVVTPTTVLVDPNGKIVFYGHSVPKLSKFLK